MVRNFLLPEGQEGQRPLRGLNLGAASRLLGVLRGDHPPPLLLCVDEDNIVG